MNRELNLYRFSYMFRCVFIHGILTSLLNNHTYLFFTLPSVCFPSVNEQHNALFHYLRYSDAKQLRIISDSRSNEEISRKQSFEISIEFIIRGEGGVCFFFGNTRFNSRKFPSLYSESVREGSFSENKLDYFGTVA